jgi:hypothetical protein
MPAMPRPKTKATKVAHKIMGVPQNIAFKRSPEQNRINKQLLMQETARVK